MNGEIRYFASLLLIRAQQLYNVDWFKYEHMQTLLKDSVFKLLNWDKPKLHYDKKCHCTFRHWMPMISGITEQPDSGWLISSITVDIVWLW